MYCLLLCSRLLNSTLIIFFILFRPCLDEEVELVLADVSEIHLQLECDLEREEKFVFLEDARTAVVIHVVRKCVHDVAQTFLHQRVWHALPQRILKHLQYHKNNC